MNVEPPKKWRYVALDFVIDNFKSILAVVVLVGGSWWSMATSLASHDAKITELEAHITAFDQRVAYLEAAITAKEAAVPVEPQQRYTAPAMVPQ